MQTETQFNTPIFNDPKPCQNKGCENGFIIIWHKDEDTGEEYPEKEKCPFCDEYGNINE